MFRFGEGVYAERTGSAQKKKQTQANSSAVFNADALRSVMLAPLRGNKHIKKAGPLNAQGNRKPANC